MRGMGFLLLPFLFGAKCQPDPNYVPPETCAPSPEFTQVCRGRIMARSVIDCEKCWNGSSFSAPRIHSCYDYDRNRYCVSEVGCGDSACSDSLLWTKAIDGGSP